MQQQKLAQIKEANDIVEAVSRHVPLKRSGRNYRALCPFHPDKEPSFYVNPERQLFKCFGCGVCETGCPAEAITLERREKFPALREEW